MITDTFYMTQVLQEIKAPILYISELTWISEFMLKSIKIWTRRYIATDKYNAFICWYKKYLKKNNEAMEWLLKFKK
jgi:hypothetical protein